jgi:peptide/nickel transport system substrate-binding protein
MPKAYAEKIGDGGISQKPVGTGPFYLDIWTKGEKLVLLKNTNYWKKDVPLADKITLMVVPDDNTRIMQLQAGQVDMITHVPFNRMAELSTGKTKVAKASSTESQYISLNSKRTELADINVRKALLHAIDREAINKAVYFDNSTLSVGLIPPTLPYYDAKLKPAEFDLEKAKGFIASSAYPDGFAVRLTVASGNTIELQIATMVKEAWSKINVVAEIQQLDSSTIFDNWLKGEYESVVFSLTSDISDTTQFASGIAISGLKNCYRTFWKGDRQKEAEELAVKANSEMDPAKRRENYEKLQAIYTDELPILPLFYVPFAVATGDKVTGFAQNPLGLYDFEVLTK